MFVKRRLPAARDPFNMRGKTGMEARQATFVSSRSLQHTSLSANGCILSEHRVLLRQCSGNLNPAATRSL
jgi:hypothetical protein